MKRTLRILCALMLSLMMILPPVGAFAAEAEQEQETPKDYVMVLDCTQSIVQNDPDRLIIRAFQNFIDRLPIMDARFSVIVFGEDTREKLALKSYQFSEDAQSKIQGYTGLGYFMTGESNYIQELIPLGPLETSRLRSNYKKQVETAVKSGIISDTQSPISHALAAAVDVLVSNGSADENACVILVTDGVETGKGSLQTDAALKYASETAEAHKWPVYSIQLNYNPYQEKEEKEDAQALISSIGKARLYEEVSAQSCTNPEEIFHALVKIFQDFTGQKPEDPDIVPLPATWEFETPDLASEVSVDIFGEQISDVVLRGPKGEEYKIDGNREDNRLIAVVEDTYYSIKMICPSSGKWTVEINGKEKVTVQIICSRIEERNLHMDAVPSSTAATLTKNDSIKVGAYLYYRDYKTLDNDFYLKYPATLCVSGKTGTKTFPMESTKDGYYLDLDLRTLPAGELDAYVELEYSGFRDGKKISNSQRFEIANLPLEVLQAGDQTLTAYTNGSAVTASGEVLDLTTLFKNPDNDYPVYYELECVSNRNEQFQWHATDGNYLELNAGIREGQYTLKIKAKDPDMDKWLEHPAAINLTIENRVPEVKSLPDMNVWVDQYSFQDSSQQRNVLNLNEYFSDPDGVKLTYTISATSEGVVIATEENGILTISPATEEEGETVLVITANDGLTTVTERVEAKTISGIKLYWKQNWIWYAAAVAVILIIIITIFLLLRNKRVKGQWIISVSENGYLTELPQLQIDKYVAIGKAKSKFTLYDLLQQTLDYAPGGGQLKTALGKYFNPETGADKITLVGVIFGKGCKVTKIPNNAQVLVSCNGIPAKKAAKVRGGSLMVEINTPTGEQLTVTMNLS